MKAGFDITEQLLSTERSLAETAAKDCHPAGLTDQAVRISIAGVVTDPGPSRNLAQWMKLIIAFGKGILHRDSRAEFNV